jgi:hypothetical protein
MEASGAALAADWRDLLPSADINVIHFQIEIRFLCIFAYDFHFVIIGFAVYRLLTRSNLDGGDFGDSRQVLLNVQQQSRKKLPIEFRRFWGIGIGAHVPSFLEEYYSRGQNQVNRPTAAKRELAMLGVRSQHLTLRHAKLDSAL